MEPYYTHKQFLFTPRQRELVLQLATKAQVNFKEMLESAVDREPGYRTPPEGLELLLQEVAKFMYHVTDGQDLPVSLSAPLLIALLYEAMKELGGSSLPEPQPGHEAEHLEWLRFYYFLSFDLTYHFAGETYWDFFTQFRSEEEIARGKQFAHHFINTAGMDRVAVFTALYNGAKPQGMGFHQDDPRDISEEEGAMLMEHNPEKGFDYVKGRRMKISRHELNKGYIDVTNYDQYNGGKGTAWSLVKHLPRR